MKAAAEFAANENESRACLNEAIDAIFDVLDTDKDGLIDLEEYTKLLQSCNVTGPKIAQAAFDSLDANHDGKIEKD